MGIAAERYATNQPCGIVAHLPANCRQLGPDAAKLQATSYGLPDLNSLVLRLIELVSRLDVEGFVERIKIAHRTIGSEGRR